MENLKLKKSVKSIKEKMATKPTAFYFQQTQLSYLEIIFWNSVRSLIAAGNKLLIHFWWNHWSAFHDWKRNPNTVYTNLHDCSRNSRPEVFCKNGDLRNFAKFTEKHMCQSLFFNKVAALRPATLSKKRLWHRCFLWI